MNAHSIPLLLLIGLCSNAPAQQNRDYPIRPVPFTEVKVQDAFWTPRLETNRQVTVWYDFKKCEETGRIDNFAVAGGLKEGGFKGIFFNDSDVVKVIEGAAYSLALHPDPKLDAYLDALIVKIAAAQEDDGYLYTARSSKDPTYNYPGKKARWSHLASGHELYNVGHMYEAAVAHWQATGKRNFLNVAIKNADLVCKVFGPKDGQRIDVPGHEEIEMGLVRLYRATGEKRYLDQAKFFIDMRGRKDLRKTYGAYCQDHVPVIEQTEAVGHAVRAGYLYAGVADVAALTGEASYIQAIDRIWQDIVTKKMHLTGGIGAKHAGEAFGAAYELPNESAYLETCAAIANGLFNHRMFLLHGDAQYIDVLERVIYNGFLSGISMQGDQFFYPNPLACNGKSKFNKGALGRAPWFGCSCCPVNVVRFVPSIPGYVYAVRDQDVYVNLFMGGSGKVKLADQTITLQQQTDYPWSGKVRIEVQTEKTANFTIRLRIPGWARNQPVPGDLYRYASKINEAIGLQVNGQAAALQLERGYAPLERPWKTGDVIELDLPMPVQRVYAHQKVEANRGRVALERGPIVYCVEAIDHQNAVYDLVLPDDADFKVQHKDELLGGVTVIQSEAQRVQLDKEGMRSSPAKLVAIPYAVWAHRTLGEMQVWLPREAALARPQPLPTIASSSRVSVSHVNHSDTASALNDQQLPASSNDHQVPRLTWWDHRGTDEWVQYDFAQPTEVSSVGVYWFDDTGRGQCRVPKSWRLSYRREGQWHPVESASDFPVAKDQFNRVRFEKVSTDALRMDISLQPEFSGGILEWELK